MAAKLKNQRWERFCEIYVEGRKTLAEVYVEAGFQAKDKKNAKNRAVQLKAKPEIQKRIAEMVDARRVGSAVKMEIKREAILERLNEIYTRCMQAEPVKNRHGDEIGEWRFDSKGAVAACRLMGIEIGMFKNVSEVWRGKLDPTDGLTHDQLKEFVLGLAAELGYTLVEGGSFNAAPSEAERSRPV